MFGIITQKFIEKVHNYFNEIGYYVDDNCDLDVLEDKIIYTICHAKDLCVAREASVIYYFFIKKYKDILKIFEKHIDKWKKIKRNKKKQLKCCSDDEALFNYVFTDYISKNPKKADLFNFREDENCVDTLFYKKGCFKISEEFKTYLKFSKRDARLIKMYDDKNNPLCEIKLTDDYNIILEKNETDLIIHCENQLCWIFDKDYYESLDDESQLDIDKSLAVIDWDAINENEEYAISCLTFFDNVNDNDFDIILLFAESAILLFESYIAHLRLQQLAISSMNIHATNMMIHNSFRR